MGKKILKVLLGFGILIVIGIIVTSWMVWKRPLKIDASFSRMALTRHGFDKTTVRTPAGGMTVWEAGSGPCMILLHGAGDQAGAWARAVPTFVDDYRVVIPDLPGHWKSDPQDGPLGIETLRGAVDVLMETVCADEQAVLVGNSMGAWVAMLYARDYPDRVLRLVLVNGGAIRQNDSTVNIFPANREEARETMKALMGPSTPPVPDFVLDDVVRHSREGPAGRFAGSLANMGGKINNYLLDDRLTTVVAPVELVWGDSDGLMTMEYADRLLEGLPRARLHVVPGCGHVPHRECPDLFAEALRTALDTPPEEAWRQELSP